MNPEAGETSDVQPVVRSEKEAYKVLMLVFSAVVI
jgi:hypothetical protein